MIYEKMGCLLWVSPAHFQLEYVWNHISEHIFEVFLNSFNEEQCILITGATITWPTRQD